jgi:hypothetical protein
MRGKPPYVILAYVIQTLKCSDDCSCVSVRMEEYNAEHPRTMWSSIIAAVEQEQSRI